MEDLDDLAAARATFLRDRGWTDPEDRWKRVRLRDEG